MGINVFSFTETDAGVFMINRKLIDIDQVVVFDACGGEGAPATKTFKLGAKYGTLPTPVRNGYTFEEMTGLDLFSALPPETQSNLESRVARELCD